MRLLQNVYQLAGCMYGVHENIYALRTGSGTVLVDTGAGAQTLALIQKGLKTWNLPPVSTVLLTHAHYEHVANAYAFAAQGARIYIHEAEAHAAQYGGDQIAEYRFLGAEPFKPVRGCLPVKDGLRIVAGEYSIEVLHSPGHSAGSVLYRVEAEGKSVVFTGDTVLAGKLCHESALGWTGGVDYDEATYVRTLASLAPLQADCVLPGHGEICLADGGRLFNGAYLQARLLVTQPHNRVNCPSLLREEATACR